MITGGGLFAPSLFFVCNHDGCEGGEARTARHHLYVFLIHLTNYIKREVFQKWFVVFDLLSWPVSL